MKDPDDTGTIDMDWPERSAADMSRLFSEWMDIPIADRPPYWDWMHQRTGLPVKEGDTIKK